MNNIRQPGDRSFRIRSRVITIIATFGAVFGFVACNREAPPSTPTPRPAATTTGGRISSELATQVAQIEAREDEVQKTVWAREMLAEECGRVFESLWDQINAATNKLAVVADFPADELVLGNWPVSTNLSHGIVLRNPAGLPSILNRDQWRAWLQSMAQAGWQLAQTEFRHRRFDTDPEGHPRESAFYFSAHLENLARAERAIVEGDLRVAWNGIRADGLPAVQRIDVSHLGVRTRPGSLPYQLIRTEQIAPANQSSTIEPLLVYDLDGDGLSEIILPVKNRVYRRQNDGSYQSGPLLRHPTGSLLSAVIADFDGDGVADLLGATLQGLLLFHGSGRTTFEKPGEIVWRADPSLVYPSVLSCGDVDGDGDLDVFLGQYKLPYRGGQMPTPYDNALDGEPAYLLLNNGQGQMTDATAPAGLEPKRRRRSLSGSLADLDGDGHLDLVVVSDFAGVDLYRGDGRGHFTEVTRQWLPDAHGFGMGHVLADFNADGRLDLLMTGMPSPTADRLEHFRLWRPDFPEDHSLRARMTYGNRLYQAKAVGGFETSPAGAAIARSGWSWGGSGFDIDNDGFPDVYVANGMESRQSVRDYEAEYWLHDLQVANSRENPAADVYLKSKATRLRGRGASYGGYEKNRLFLNQAGTAFVEVAYLFGVALEQDSRSVVSEDLDGDGRMDLLVTSFEPWPHPSQTLRIYQNTLKDTGHWIGFRFHEAKHGTSPVGVQVTVRSGAYRAIRQLVTGDSHNAQHANTAHFGLGQLDRVESVEVRTPNGRVWTLSAPAVNRYHLIELPKAEPTPR